MVWSLPAGWRRRCRTGSWAIPPRLRQVLLNLAGNAIKFTEEGEVLIAVTLAEEQPASGDVRLEFSVSDTGIGISPEAQAGIFEAFQQADTSVTRRYGGTGLGLAISSQLVALMNGKIWVESRLGRRLHLLLHGRVPRVRSRGERSTGTDSAGRPRHSRGGRQRHQPVHLRGNPARLAHAARGGGKRRRRSGPASGRPASAGNPIGLAVIDVMMPDEDGYSLIRKIRASEEIETPTLIVASSAFESGERERAVELGVAKFLVKPVTQSELLNALLESLGPTVAEEVPQAEEEAGGGLHILLAEDSVINQRVALGLLNRWGHHVDVVADGRDAVEAIENNDYELVLMDVNMPVMDGLEATAIVRRKEAENGSHTPIIAMTASAMKGDRERFLAVGMDEYVSKPFDAEVLKKMIDGYAARADVIDWNAARSLTGGDEGLLDELVEMFPQESAKHMEAIGDAIESGDGEALNRAAHTLKSAARLFGASALADCAQQIETLAGQGEIGEARDRVPELARALERVLGALRQGRGQ